MSTEAERIASLEAEIESLREGEAQMRAILNGISANIAYVNRDLKIRWANRTAALSAGRQPEELLGQKCHAIWANPDKPCRDCPAVKAFESGRAEHTTMRTPDGRIWDERGEPVYDDHGQLVGVVELAVDVTERKQTEESLRKHRYYLEKAQEIGHIGTWDLNLERNELYWTDENYRVFGVPLGTPLTYEVFLEQVVPEDRPLVSRAWQGALRGEPYDIEHRLQVDGQIKWVREKAEVEFDDQGRAVRGIGFTQDITDRVRSEEALRQSEDKYRYLFDHMSEGVFYQEADGRLTDVNQSCLDLFGLTRDEFLNRTSEHRAWRVICEDGSEPPPHEHPSMVALRTGQPVCDQVLAVFNEQRQDWVWFNITAIPQFRDGERAPFRAFVTLHDITERRRATEQLIESQKMEAIGRLAGGVAHDMNNMLAGIVGFASLIRVEFAPDNAIAADAGRILDICAQARKLTDNLLGFARKGKYRREAVDLNQAIVRVTGLLSRTVPRQIRIGTDLAQDLPVVEGDPVQLEQALMNLCLNAVQALGERGELRLQTSSIQAEESGPRQVEVIVYDSGCGMSPEVLAHAFEPFFTTKPPNEGSGLGLAMVYGAVEHHGGVVSIQSQPGEGTRVRILLPALAGGGQGRPLPKPEPGLAAPQKPRLLVVDDEEMVRRATGRMLERMGYEILFACDGQEAVDLYAERGAEIDLVLLDLGMPRMDGMETFRRLREMDSQVAVLILSGYSADDQAATMLDLGARGFLQKPVLPEDLDLEIARVLRLDRD